MITPLDWILAAILSIALPAYAAWSYPRFRRRVADGIHGARVREYAETIKLQWGLVLALGLFWAAHNRGLDALGLGLPLGSGRFLLAVGLALALVFFLVLNTRSVLRDPKKQREVREQLGTLTELVPRSRTERRWFAALSITAGICEEILYRGFLLWMFSTLWGLPVAVLLTTVVFGAGHLYQGVPGFFRTGAVGLVAVGLTILAGSVWPAVVLHIALDLAAGRTLTGSLSDPEGDTDNLASPLLADS